MRITLSESGIPVRKISILWLCRNNQEFLPHLFDTLIRLEKTYDCDFEYFIAENGSSDDTRTLLTDFLHGRVGKIITPEDTSFLDQQPRTERLARIRNTLLDNIRPLQSDWAVLLDTDIYFTEEILADMFALSPSQKGIGMLCAFGMEGLPERKGTGGITRLGMFFANGMKGFPKSTEGGWITQSHYYDTWAFLDEDNRFYWPHCIFSGCGKCSAKNAKDKLNAAGVVNVNSAFGGFAIVKSQLLNHPDLRWKAVPSEDSDIRGSAASERKMMLCEHIHFCKMLRKVSSLSVAIACDIPVYWDLRSYRS